MQLKHCIPWRNTRILLRKILLDNELQAMHMLSVACVVLLTEKDILKYIACMHSLAMKACDQEGLKGSEKRTKRVAKQLVRANHLFGVFETD